MFQIAQSETYTAPVTVESPGVKTKQTFDAEFRRLSQAEVKAMYEKARTGEIDDAQFCREIVVGWSGIKDEHGEVDFSPRALDSLLEIYPLASSIVQAFNASIAGSRTKN
jgi:Phage tail assembly chaperone